MRKITFALAVALLFGFLVSCGGCAGCSGCSKTVKLETKQEGFYNEKLEVYYSIAPSTYEAIGYVKEAYAVDSHGFTFHIVTDMGGNRAEASDWLYDATNTALLYNSDKKLPTLKDMKPATVDFFVEGNTRVNLITLNSADEISKIIACLDNPFCSQSSIRAELNDSYGLRFTSLEYKYIAYVLDYVEFSQNIYEYEKAEGYTDAADVEARYEFKDGVEYEIVAEEDGSYTVKYDYGKYFIYDKNVGRYYMASYIHETYNSGENK